MKMRRLTCLITIMFTQSMAIESKVAKHHRRLQNKLRLFRSLQLNIAKKEQEVHLQETEASPTIRITLMEMKLKNIKLLTQITPTALKCHLHTKLNTKTNTVTESMKWKTLSKVTQLKEEAQRTNCSWEENQLSHYNINSGRSSRIVILIDETEKRNWILQEK